MTDRDQDIHRIQEIRQLLESRQRFFGGLQVTAESYKVVDSKVNPLTLQSNMLGNPNEHSLGHSVEANFGSSSASGNSNSQMNYNKLVINQDFGEQDSDISSDETGKDVTSSFGHYCADNSQNESSSVISSDEKDAGTKKKKTVRLKRRPKGDNSLSNSIVQDYLEKVEQPALEKRMRKSGKISSSLANPSSTDFRKKSVTFHKILTNADGITTTGEKKTQKKSQMDPLLQLKKQRYALRAEAVKGLDLDDDAALSTLVKLERQGVLGLTTGTLAIAREKLKLAEKSLRVTVKTTENMPIKSFQYSLEVRKPPQILHQQAAKLPRKAISRLALRQQEEAIRSDMNLREAFALIKINPDPLLDLAPADSIIDKLPGHRGGSVYITEEKGMNFHIPSVIGTPGFEDPETVKSLRRLTKLSVQHQKAQKSLIPESVKSQIVMQSFKSQDKKVKESPVVKRTSVASTLASRRRSSTTMTGNMGQRKFFRKRSSDRGIGIGGPKMAFSGLEAALRAERRGQGDSEGGNPRYGYHSVEKLSSTIL